MVFDANPPFAPITSINTGPITNHVNFARTRQGTFAYVSVGGLNVVKVFRTDDFTTVATIPVGKLPHGVWPSGDGSRIYVGIENADELVAVDTATNTVVGRVPIGQGSGAGCAGRSDWIEPGRPYVLALADHADGSGTLQPLANFMTNPAGSAIVNTIGPIRQIVQPGYQDKRHYLVIATQDDGKPGRPVQVQVPK
jgi:YVTN family beta-propeller protein